MTKTRRLFCVVVCSHRENPTLNISQIHVLFRGRELEKPSSLEIVFCGKDSEEWILRQQPGAGHWLERFIVMERIEHSRYLKFQCFHKWKKQETTNNIEMVNQILQRKGTWHRSHWLNRWDLTECLQDNNNNKPGYLPELRWQMKIINENGKKKHSENVKKRLRSEVHATHLRINEEDQW